MFDVQTKFSQLSQTKFKIKKHTFFK